MWPGETLAAMIRFLYTATETASPQVKLKLSSIPSRYVGWSIAGVVALALTLTRESWIPALDDWVDQTIASFQDGAAVAEEAEDDHGAHGSQDSLKLSPQGRRNIGLTGDMLGELELRTYHRSITLPAMVVEQRGRTHMEVSAPMTGVITSIEVLQGEAVSGDRLLFRMRLTHEDLVTAQTAFLRTLGELDVERKEIERLKHVTSEGAVAGKVMLEHEYQRERLEAILRAQRESLLLHGLNEAQIGQIEGQPGDASSRTLIGELEVRSPALDVSKRDAAADVAPETEPRLIIQDLRVHKGQAVSAGETLCVLADMSRLHIEGRAFDQDSELLESAFSSDWPVSAIRRSSQQTQSIDNLKLAFIDNEVHEESRVLRVYVDLPNQLLRRQQTSDGRTHISWRFKPGQRMKLRIPVEELKQQFVLPVDAVVKEAAESFVFVQNGDYFDRRPVHILFRDQLHVVIANDGALFEGDVVALTGAHQMHIALKNEAGGGVDAHHGHVH